MSKKQNNGTDDESLVFAGKELTLEDEMNILKGGTVGLEQFLENFQFLIFVLDESGSMQDRLPSGDTPKREVQKRIIKRYVDEKIGRKAGTMKIGVVSFDDEASVWLQGSSDPVAIKAAADQCRGGGGTHLGRGILKGLSLLHRMKDYIPRLVLTSDGEAHDPAQAIAGAEAAKAKGVVIDTVYIGPGGGGDVYADNAADLMRRIAEITGGVFERVNNQSEFETKFFDVIKRPLLATSLK